MASQDKSKDNVWRPVSTAEIQSKNPLVEPDADAEAIFWEVKIDDSHSDLSMSHYVRVKIYSERGREKYSKFDIPFTKKIKIKDLAARVIRADGSTVEVTKNDIFEREIIKVGGQKIKAKSFAVPNIEPGVIIEYRYREVIEDAGANGMQLPFQRDIPIQKLSYYYKPAHKEPPSYQSYNFTDTKFVEDKDGYWLASRTDVPSLKEEPRMPPDDMVRAWMLVTGVQVIDFGSFSFHFKESSDPWQYWAGFSSSRGEITKWMNKDNKDITKTAMDIAAGATTTDEKLKRIYEFCQTQINNTSYDTTLTDEMRAKLPKTKAVNDILKRRSGSILEIDYLFGALAHALGFETAVAFTGNRSKVFFTPDMVNKNLVRIGAIAVKSGKEWSYFDPGSKYLAFGMLPWYEEATWAIVVGEERFEMKQTPYTDYKGSTTNRTAKFILNEDGLLEGDVTVELNGQPALDYRVDNYDETPAKREVDLEDDVKGRINGAEVTNAVVENATNGTKPLVKKYHVRVPNFAQKTGKRIFFQPNYFKYGLGPDFSSSTRKYDIFFQYPWGENDNIEIKWPSGYELDNADSPADVADPKQIGVNKIQITVDRNQNILKYSRKFHFGGGGGVLFDSKAYVPLKGLFDAFHTADSHSITLKQK